MNDPSWTTVDGLLEAALERPAEERAAFLQQACPDEALRREVESLLAHAGEAGSSWARRRWT